MSSLVACHHGCSKHVRHTFHLGLYPTEHWFGHGRTNKVITVSQCSVVCPRHHHIRNYCCIPVPRQLRPRLGPRLVIIHVPSINFDGHTDMRWWQWYSAADVLIRLYSISLPFHHCFLPPDKHSQILRFRAFREEKKLKWNCLFVCSAKQQ